MDSPLVTVSQGQLRGCVRINIDGGKFLSFLGIPYAKPPIGELRFKAPLPAELWQGIRDATREGDACYAMNDMTGQIAGSEDCLSLNVYTKALPHSSNTLKPVMVYIHGGGFVTGSNASSFHGPELLMTEDIVLVVLNYRLGILGFLSLQDTSLGVPGNAGLKDQALALKWVQQNISRFNGDPNNVTIFGESAGAGSVHYHILSKSSRGLFHKAILQSGVAINPWALGFHVAEEFAKYFGHDVQNETEAIEVLRKLPADVLVKYQNKFMKHVKSKGRPFGPIIEKPNATAFITNDAIDIIRSGEYNKVPMIMGYNTREGMLLDVMKVIESRLSEKSDKRESEQDDTEEAVFSFLELKKESEIDRKIYQKILEVYFKGSDNEDNKRVLASDAHFVAGILATVKYTLATMREPIYLYRMSLVSGLNFFKNFAQLNHIPGTCHADDLGYLFKSIVTPEIKPGSLEDVSFRRFVKLWTNFARCGNPTPNKDEVEVIWPRVKEGRLNYLDIGSELTLGTNPEAKRMALWDELFKINPKIAKF